RQNRTHSISLSKSETNKIVKRLTHSDPAVAGEESQTVSATTANNTDQRCFAQPVLSEAEGLNMTEPILQIAKCAGRIGELDSNDRWGLAYWASDLSIVARSFLSWSASMLFWIFDEPSWQFPLF